MIPILPSTVYAHSPCHQARPGLAMPTRAQTPPLEIHSPPAFRPNLFLLGAAKCGTTTACRLLGSLPEVCFSNPKEPWFFEVEYEQGLPFYRSRYFPHWSGEPVVADGRHRNLFLPWVPSRIHETNPDARLIVLVRNPVERAYSHWWYACNHGQEPKSFPQAIRADLKRIERGLRYDTEQEMHRYRADIEESRQLNISTSVSGACRTYVDTGYYMEQVERYLRLFPPENLLVLVFDDLVRDQAATVGRIQKFLNIEPTPPESIRPEHGEKKEPLTAPWIRQLANRRLTRRILPWFPDAVRKAMRSLRDCTTSWPEMDRRTRDRLRQHYQPHIAALQDFLGRDLSHWR